MPLLGIGSRAPGFSATGSDNRRYSLDALLVSGAVALFFYPGNNSPG